MKRVDGLQTFDQNPPALFMPCRFYVPLPSGANPDVSNAEGDVSECNIQHTSETVTTCSGTFNVIHVGIPLIRRPQTGNRMCRCRRVRIASSSAVVAHAWVGFAVRRRAEAWCVIATVQLRT